MILGYDDPLTMQRQIWKRTIRKAVGAIRKVTVTDTFGALEDEECDAVRVSNGTGKVLKFRRGGAGEFITIPDGAIREIDVAAKANEIQIANATDTASVDVKYELLGEK